MENIQWIHPEFNRRITSRYTKTLLTIETRWHVCGSCDPNDDDDCKDCATDLCNGANFKSYIALPLIVVSAWLMF